MPEYKCLNKDCSLHNESKTRNTILKVVDGKLIDSGIICPECNEVCLAIAKTGFTTNMRGGINVCKK